MTSSTGRGEALDGLGKDSGLYELERYRKWAGMSTYAATGSSLCRYCGTPMAWQRPDGDPVALWEHTLAAAARTCGRPMATPGHCPSCGWLDGKHSASCTRERTGDVTDADCKHAGLHRGSLVCEREVRRTYSNGMFGMPASNMPLSTELTREEWFAEVWCCDCDTLLARGPIRPRDGITLPVEYRDAAQLERLPRLDLTEPTGEAL